MTESLFNNLLSLLYIQELKEQYIEGGPTEVAITEVDVFHRRFVCSEALALEHRTLRGIKCVLFATCFCAWSVPFSLHLFFCCRSSSDWTVATNA